MNLLENYVERSVRTSSNLGVVGTALGAYAGYRFGVYSNNFLLGLVVASIAGLLGAGLGYTVGSFVPAIRTVSSAVVKSVRRTLEDSL